jgi:hypothetical protein
LEGKSAIDKNELLFQAGVNFKELPSWQGRGTGLYWASFEREGYHPKLELKVIATRRRVKVDRELPIGEEYAGVISRLLRQEKRLRQGSAIRAGNRIRTTVARYAQRWTKSTASGLAGSRERKLHRPATQQPLCSSQP